MGVGRGSVWCKSRDAARLARNFTHQIRVRNKPTASVLIDRNVTRLIVRFRNENAHAMKAMLGGGSGFL